MPRRSKSRSKSKSIRRHTHRNPGHDTPRRSKLGSNTNPKRSKHRNPDDDLPNLRDFAYSDRRLAKTLIRNASIPFMSKLNDSEKREIRRGLSNHNLQGEELQRTIREVMAYFWHIFDKAFYFGAFAKHPEYKLIFVPFATGAPTLWDRTGAEFDANTSTISMRTFGPGTEMFYPGRSVWEVYVATLLHEMLHAFLCMHHCQCEKCQEEGHTVNKPYKWSGHDSEWCNAMVALQDSLMKGTGWNIDCEITNAVEKEIGASGLTPSADQLHRWGVRGIQPGSSSAVPDGVRRRHRRHVVEEEEEESEESDDESDDDSEYEDPGFVISRMPDSNGDERDFICCTVM